MGTECQQDTTQRMVVMEENDDYNENEGGCSYGSSLSIIYFLLPGFPGWLSDHLLLTVAMIRISQEMKTFIIYNSNMVSG